MLVIYARRVSSIFGLVGSRHAIYKETLGDWRRSYNCLEGYYDTEFNWLNKFKTPSDEGEMHQIILCSFAVIVLTIICQLVFMILHNYDH